MLALITGASAGIGEATAKALAQAGMDLVICGRRKEKLETLAQFIHDTYHTKTKILIFDVGIRTEVENALQNLPQEWQNIDILINNAGNAHGLSTIQEGNVEDWEKMIDYNIKGVLYVSHCIIPNMIARQKGHIVNIGSIAGKENYPKGNVYCASKSAVISISESMRMDLVSHQIKVSVVNPGAVETEFSLVRFKGDAQKASQIYQGYTPLSAQDIAEIIAFMVTRPAHVNIADVLVLPIAQASATVWHKQPF
jgi:3-hydroxy acid dehydrogenase / malonic semialdehyde reductase